MKACHRNMVRFIFYNNHYLNPQQKYTDPLFLSNSLPNLGESLQILSYGV